MKNGRRIKISQSQLARLVENKVNEQNHSTGKTTQNQNNIGIGSNKIVTTTHMDRPADPWEYMNENSHTLVHSDQQDLFAEEEDNDYSEVRVKSNPNKPKVRRSDRDKARRRPYSAKARDMRGSRQNQTKT